ncbi:MAG: hypothetical protein HJJLKODD_01167 [Phycisphaerae bacterium]|nr:hypothetical protein [Phycisphaerae bacterium]
MSTAPLQSASIPPPRRSGSPPPKIVELLLGLVFIGGNILFVWLVGHWLSVTAAVGVLLGLVWLMGWLGPAERRRLLFDLLMAETAVSFNIWAFSNLNNLLGYIGLFFYALFGLIMAAAWHRLLQRWQPLSKARIALVGFFLIVIPWCGALVLETSYLPKDALFRYKEKIRYLPPGLTEEQINLDVPRQIEKYLADRYESTGVLRYLQWAVDDGRLPMTVPGRTKPIVFYLQQHKLGFKIRLVLSMGLLAYAVFVVLTQLNQPKNVTPTNTHPITESQ